MAEANPTLPERLQALAQVMEDNLDPRMPNEVLEPTVKMVFDLREASRLLLEVPDRAAEREEAFRDLAEVAYGDREAVWTSPRTLVKAALAKRA